MNKREQKFIDIVWDFYRTAGRHDLPWRKTTDPYKILVSEIMLQQTQVERVLPKYKSFIKKWGSVKKLATASLGDVLIEWQGLGYNRRARMLHKCAQEIAKEWKCTWPTNNKELQELPGVGPYTAGAILAFAYNEAVPIIETNIRTVYLHHFFSDANAVDERDIKRLIERTIDTKNAREWYWALMDYGSFLKRTTGNQNGRAKSYKKQSRFKGSDREIRGALIRMLSKGTKSLRELKTLNFDEERLKAQLEKLLREGMIESVRTNRYRLPQ